MEPEEPLLPYNGTSGWSGSESSYDRAVGADRSGTTLTRQQTVLRLVRKAGERGLTWREVSDLMERAHHGTVSGALSVLHKEGLIERLIERRNRCQVYVAPEYVAGRDAARHGRLRRACANCGHVVE